VSAVLGRKKNMRENVGGSPDPTHPDRQRRFRGGGGKVIGNGTLKKKKESGGKDDRRRKPY